MFRHQNTGKTIRLALGTSDIKIQSQNSKFENEISIRVFLDELESHTGLSWTHIFFCTGDQMKISMEEAVRAVKVKYPKWENREIRISFGDKYSEKDGGSAGAAYALLTLSLLDGFEIDPFFDFLLLSCWWLNLPT